jgi:hypothetical protein
MRVLTFACATAVIALAGGAQAATISGTVTGADSKPVAGVFVQGEDKAANRLINVLSDNAGHYRLPDLPAGEWVISAHGTGSDGLDSMPQTATVTADQNLTLEVKTKPAPLKWSEISMSQGRTLLPDAKGKTSMFQNCFACHGFETRMSEHGPHNEQEWKALVDYMQNSMHFFLGTVGHVGPDEEKELVSYFTATFGPNSHLPAPDTLLRCETKLWP